MRLSARKTKNENQITLSSLLKKKKKSKCALNFIELIKKWIVT